MAGRADPGGPAGGADAAARAPEGISRGRKLKVGAGPTQEGSRTAGRPRGRARDRRGRRASSRPRASAAAPALSCPAWGADGPPDLGGRRGPLRLPRPRCALPLPDGDPGPWGGYGGPERRQLPERAEPGDPALPRVRCHRFSGRRAGSRWTRRWEQREPGTAAPVTAAARPIQRLAGRGVCRASRLALRDSGATCPWRWGRQQLLAAQSLTLGGGPSRPQSVA